MQSALTLALLLLTAQVTGGGRYEGYESEGGVDPNQGARSSEFFSPVTPAERPVDAGRPASEKKTVPQVEVRSAERPPAATQPIKPAELLASLANAPETGKLAGELVALKDAVANARTRREQTEIIQAYWELSAAVTDYYLSSREATELQALRQGVAQPSMAWEESQRALTARMQLARRTAEMAQHRLHKLMKNPAIQGLPLPVDIPHTGAYETRYDENFSGRESKLSRELHELVPSIYRTLSLQAAQVNADERWRNTVSQNRSAQSNGLLLLKTQELVCLRRREFVRTVSEYNSQIARYTELASPGLVGTERLVAMLIEDPSPSTLMRKDRDVRTAGSEEPVEDADSGPPTSRPRTFDEGDHSSRRVVPGTPKGEHSIMVKPI